MTNHFEGDPVRDIVNIDSFNSFLQGYISDVVQNTPQGKSYLQRMKQFDSHMKVGGYKIEELKISLPTFFPITWGNIPWEQIPESIQDVLLLHYEQRAPEEKAVDITLLGANILFSLDSPNVVELFDRYRETVASGIELQLVDETAGLPDSSKSFKGNWYFGQKSVAKSMKVWTAGEGIVGGTTEAKLEKLKGAMEDIDQERRQTPVSPNQLKDIANFFIRHREGVSIGYKQDKE